MDDLSSVTTVQELVDFVSNLVNQMVTQEYVDQQLEKRVAVETLDGLLSSLVTKTEFNQLMAAKAGKADLISAVASKANRDELTTGISRKANVSALYALEAKVGKIFPFKCVENIAERNALFGDDLNKVILVIDASGDENKPEGSVGALYTYSSARTKWICQSGITYNAEQISYNAILGRPKASASEIDTAVSTVIEKIGPIRQLPEAITKMHVHGSTLADIESAVEKKHDHTDVLKLGSIDDSDLIPVLRDGQLFNVEASVLKAYLNR